MLRIFAALSISLFCITTNASTDVNIEGYCLEVAKLSRAVMTSRQYGDPIENALAVRDRAFEKNNDDGARAINTEIIIEAYDVPRYFTEKFIQSEINEFAAKNYVTCIQTMRLAKKNGEFD